MKAPLKMLSFVGVVLAFITFTTTSATAQHKDNDEHHAELTLNNGQKWNADAATNARVKKMQELTYDFRQSNRTDYATLGNEMQTQIDSLISACKMKGPDHDALHVWLMPVMRYTKKLHDADKKEAAEAYHELNERLTLYDAYFK